MTAQYKGRYRFFSDPGHGWLEVPRAEVVASGAQISRYSYYDPHTDMAYLEEDCDQPAFLKAAGFMGPVPIDRMDSDMPRQLPAYGADAIANRRIFIDDHILVVRPTGNGGLR